MTCYAPKPSGGWGLAPGDVDVAAHSLGNLVVWDALRLDAAMNGSNPTPLIHNFVSIEAAVRSEAFDPESPLSLAYTAYETVRVDNVEVTVTHDVRVNETVAQQRQSGWRSWFNPSPGWISGVRTGRVIHSYAAGDSALEAMRWNEVVMRNDHDLITRTAFHLTPPVFRTASNLAALPSYVVDGGSVSGNPVFGMSLMGNLFLRRPVGTLPNPVADLNVDATGRGWEPAAHSDHVDRDYPRIWAWYDRVFRELGGLARGAQR